MQRAVILAFAVIAYALFFGVFLWFIGFVGDFRGWVPTTVESGPAGPPIIAALIDIALIALFGIQHSVMARQPFKRWLTGTVPASAERSVYVLSASIMLALLMLQWRPIQGTLWDLTGSTANTALWVVFFAGWTVLFVSTFLINHFELFGLSQAWRHGREAPPVEVKLREPLFYRFVRHPLYLGFVLAFWATPLMTYGHLLLAIGMTGYILVGIRYEERDLIAHFGRSYEDYRARVGMLLPGLGRRG